MYRLTCKTKASSPCSVLMQYIRLMKWNQHHYRSRVLFLISRARTARRDNLIIYSFITKLHAGMHSIVQGRYIDKITLKIERISIWFWSVQGSEDIQHHEEFLATIPIKKTPMTEHFRADYKLLQYATPILTGRLSVFF